MKSPWSSSFFKVFLGMAGLSAVSLCFAQNNVSPAEFQRLEDSVESLKLQLQDLQVRQTLGQGQVKTFLNDTISFGGFFETGTTYLEGEDTKTLFSSNSHTLGINLSVDFESRFSLNAQTLTWLIMPLQNPHNNPRGEQVGLSKEREFGNISIDSTVPQGYLEYRESENLNVQIGLGYVPFGIAMQQRELVLFRRREGPQLLTASRGGVTIASPIWTGAHIYGDLLNKRNFDYNLYTVTPLSDPSSLGVGGRISWESKDNRSRTGVSSQVAKRDGEPYQAFGLDFELKKEKWGVTAEGAVNVIEDSDDPWSFYIEPFYTFDDDTKLFYLALDYLDEPLGQTIGRTGTLEDAYRKWVYAAGINWLPHSYIRMRIGLSVHDYVGDRAQVDGRNRDYNSLDFSAGIAF